MTLRFPIPGWRRILDERAQESAEAVLQLDGVVDVIIGGSVGRGDSWPYSDIDLVPVTNQEVDYERASLRLRSQLAAEWTASGWVHVLDVGRLVISADEAEALSSDPTRLADMVAEPRLMHATDKIVHGRPSGPRSVGEALVAAVTGKRHAVEVRRARFDQWMAIVNARLTRAEEALGEGRVSDAVTTAQVAGPLAAAALEAWSEREGSMTKFATHFEHHSAAHGHGELASEIATIARSEAEDVCREITHLPTWLEVGEDVSEIQNRRDQILLFLGRPGLPTAADWLTERHSDAPDYLDRVDGLRESVARLRP
jgi:predicted nucleotidyltransferase